MREATLRTYGDVVKPSYSADGTLLCEHKTGRFAFKLDSVRDIFAAKPSRAIFVCEVCVKVFDRKTMEEV